MLPLLLILFVPLTRAQDTVYLHYHIAKSGGRSLHDFLVRIPELRECKITNHNHFSCEKYDPESARSTDCNFFSCEGNWSKSLSYVQKAKPGAAVRDFALLRRPHDHLLSRYDHCQQEGADGMRRHHYPSIDINTFFNLNATEKEKHCSYEFDNPQLSYISGGNLAEAIDTVDTIWLVATTDQMQDVLCFLEENITRRGATLCHKHVERVRHGTQPRKTSVNGQTIKTISQLTLKDILLFTRAYERFAREHGN